jgi:hypothetical protein
MSFALDLPCRFVAMDDGLLGMFTINLLVILLFLLHRSELQL